MTLITEIVSKRWSMSVASVGSIVADEEDIKQCVALIVFTKKNTVPFLPEFGCDWFNYIDQPANTAAPLMLREIRNAIARWEPRATVLNSSFSIDVSTLHLTLELSVNFTRSKDPASSLFITFDLDTPTGLMS